MSSYTSYLAFMASITRNMAPVKTKLISCWIWNPIEFQNFVEHKQTKKRPKTWLKPNQ